MKIGRGDGIFFAVLVCAVTVVFGSSLFFTEAVMDDVIYVRRIHLLSFSLNNLKLWSNPVIGLWSPLVGYSFMLDYFVWGKEHLFFGAHFVNILLHLIAAAGFYTGLRMLKFSRLAAGLAVLVWTIHPQRAESVAWMSERKDVLLLAFGVWSIVFFVQSLKRKNTGLYVLSAVLFALTFFIKPALIGLPLVLTVYQWGRYRKTDWRFYVKYSGIFWLLSLVYYIAFRCIVSPGNNIGTVGFLNQLSLMGWRYGSYFVKTFIPYGLNPYYPHFSLADHSLMPLYAVCAVWLLLLEFCRRRNKKAIYLYLPLLLSFSAAVAPGLFKIGDVDFADRYSYFPSIFLLLAAASAISALVRHFPVLRKAVVLLCCCLAVSWGMICFDRVLIWENEEAFSAACLDEAKPNYRRLIADTVVKFDKRDWNGAMENLVRLRRDYADEIEDRMLTIRLFADSLEGVIISESGNPGAGMKKVFQVLSHPKWKLLFNTTFGYPRFLLLKAAGFSQRAGHRKDAAELYRRVAELYSPIEPMEKEFYLALAALCQDDKITALRHFENAHKLNPGDENIRKNIEILKKVQAKRH